jgi:ribonuclease Z
LTSETKIKFLGTGSGRTSLKRFHSSLIISCDDLNYIVDCGDGTTRALLTQQIDFNSIDGIILTHMHPDHFAGLASLLVQMKMGKREKPLTIHLYKEFIDPVKQILYYQFVFLNRYKFDIRFTGFDYDIMTRLSENMYFMARNNSHLDDMIKDAGIVKINFSSSSFLFKINNNVLLYTGDIGKVNDLYIFNDFNIDMMISDATHITPAEIITAINSFSVKKLYLTHISDDEEEKIVSYFKTPLATTTTKIIIAEDGMDIMF